MDEHRSISRRITDEVTSWPGVEAGPGTRYGLETGEPADRRPR